MLKKGWLIFCTFLLIILCTACAQKEMEGAENNIEAVVTGNLQALAAMDDDDINIQLSQYDSETAGDIQKVLAEALENWKDIRKDMGEYISCGNFKERKSGKEVTGTVRGHFAKRDMDFSMTFNEDFSKLKNITLNPVYSIGELLKKAGLNTLMGMGTVFTVLILISIVIYAFGFIGRRQNRKAAISSETAAEIKIESEMEQDLSNDLELVAVIAAAIAASENVPVDSLVVRSIRRKKTIENWKNI